MSKNHISPVDLDDLAIKQRGQLVSKHIYLSNNAKTGVSVNSRIGGFTRLWGGKKISFEGSCAPTEWCRVKCYARGGHFSYTPQQTRYLLNSVLFDHYASCPYSDLEHEADSLVGRVMESGLANIRWNGGGDLSPGAVRLINAITDRHPDFIVWGFSRRADMLGRLHARPNLRFTVSTDPTTPPWGRKGHDRVSLMHCAKRLGGRVAYATGTPQDPKIKELRAVLKSEGLDLGVVFGEHRGPRHTIVGDPYECPSTKSSNGKGCQECRWCFMSKEEKVAEGRSTP